MEFSRRTSSRLLQKNTCVLSEQRENSDVLLKTESNIIAVNKTPRKTRKRPLEDITNMNDIPTQTTLINKVEEKTHDSSLSLWTRISQEAKQVFRRTITSSVTNTIGLKPIHFKLIGRDEERRSIMNFWKEHILQGVAGSLYISGSPGTGKTALMAGIIEELESWHKDVSHSILC
jgi:predicted ATPase